MTIIFDGIAFGMLLFLISVGLSVTLGLMNFVNLAHGVFAMVGGYVCVVLLNDWGVPFLATIPFAIIVPGLVGVLLERDGGDLDDASAAAAVARRLTAEALSDPAFRTRGAGEAASRVAVIPEVRAALLEFQRRFARRPGGAVLDGRDIGTVICPAAEVKLYVTASAEVRAHRRWLEVGGDAARVLAEVQDRDARDMGRDHRRANPAPAQRVARPVHWPAPAGAAAGAAVASNPTSAILV